MAKIMRKIAAIDGKGYGCVIRQEIPPVKKGMLHIDVRASLISPGTELASVKNKRANPSAEMPPPKPFGYQNAGVVVEVGEGVSEFEPGDRVACMGSGYALHADRAVVPQKLCAILPENVGFEEGAFAHLAMTSLQAIRRGKPELGEYVLVVGLGIVGQIAARLGQLAGAYVMGWDMLDSRTGIARQWGIDATALAPEEDLEEEAESFTDGYGFDMAVVAIGGEATETLHKIKSVMKISPDRHSMGRICLVGGAKTVCRWGAALGNLDLRCCARTGPGYHDKTWEVGEREYPHTFVRWDTRSSMQLVLRLISEGKLDVGSLITHRFPLDRIDDAITMQVKHPDSSLGTLILYNE